MKYCISHNPLTHMFCSPVVRTSRELNWEGRCLTGLRALTGCTLQCSSFSTGWCCSRTPCGHHWVLVARCRTQWRCQWAGRTPAAWEAGLSHAAMRTRNPLPSSVCLCTWQSGTGQVHQHKAHTRLGGSKSIKEGKLQTVLRHFYQLKEADSNGWLLFIFLSSI